MIGILLALFAAIANGSAAILVKKELDKSNVLNATFVVTVVGTVIIWSLVPLYTNLNNVRFEGLFLFALAGALAPGIGRLFYYKGVDVIGVSANATIFATYPMYSSILAVFLLNEMLSPVNWIGIICITLGVVYIEKISGKSNHKKNETLFFSIVATLFMALSQIIRKYGLGIYNEPLLGAAVGYAISLLLYIPLLIFSNTTPMQCHFSLGRDFRLFWRAGVSLSIGWILAYYALSNERVSIVTSILQTEALFVNFFVYIFLRKLEHITLKLVISALIIVIGTILLVS